MQDAVPLLADDGFTGLGLGPELIATLAELGYEEPTPIQREAIPPLIAGRDILAEAPTGTGKTAAFALPALQRLATAQTGEPGRARSASDGRVAILVLVPTRELAMQVSDAIHRYGQRLGTRVLPVYGGQPIGQQLRALQRGVDVVVATPGRAVDHLKRGSLQLAAVELVVLDEADEMLDMGFAEDLDAVLSATGEGRQTALFSATISPTIARIARKHLRDPIRVRVQPEKATRDGVARVRQVAYVVRRPDKLAALSRILDLEDPSSALVFARTRGEVDELAERLGGRGHDAGALHGGMSQELRDRVMGRFRDGALDVLVATDVAARGLDIEHVSHVVNYDVPSDPDAYVHRIGRTGRAGREGVAITMVEPREHRLLRNIEAATRTRLEIAQIPTVADLREHRLDILRATLRETLLAGGHERLRAVIEPLAEEFDLVDVTLAALSLAEGAARREGDEDAEIAPATLFDSTRPTGPRAVGRSADRSGGPEGRSGSGRPPAGGRSPGASGGSGAGWARIHVGGGRRAGLRPGDLVGAITHEAGVPGSVIGAIQIADAFSLVDVREDAVDHILRSLEGATIRGKAMDVRRDRS